MTNHRYTVKSNILPTGYKEGYRLLPRLMLKDLRIGLIFSMFMMTFLPLVASEYSLKFLYLAFTLVVGLFLSFESKDNPCKTHFDTYRLYFMFLKKKQKVYKPMYFKKKKAPMKIKYKKIDEEYINQIIAGEVE